MKYFEPLIFMILAVLPLLFLGTNPIADSLANLQIYPQGLINDRLYSWSSSQLGSPTGWGSSYLIIGSFYVALSTLLPLWLVERVFFFLILFTSGYSMFLLAIEHRITRSSAFIAALFFMYSYFLTIFFKGASVMVLAYAFCPLLLLLTMRGLKAKDYRYALLIGLLTCLFAGINPPEAILALVPSAAYTIYWLIARRDRFVIGFGAIVVIIGLLVNLFWIIPGIASQQSIFGQGVWSETPYMHNKFTSYPEVIRGLGFWGFYDGWNGVPYYSWASFFIESPLGIMLSFIVPFCAFAALLTKRAREPWMLIIAVMMVMSIPLAVGAYPQSGPGTTGTVYMWLYDNVPLFNTFRSSYKFVMILTLCYALFFGIFLDSIKGKVTSFLRKRGELGDNRARLVKLAIVLIAATTVMAAYWPAWTGQIQDRKAEFEVPSYYEDIKEYFQDMPDKRLMLTPGRYFSQYEWGHIAVEVLDVMLDNPIVYQNPGDANSSLPGIKLVNFLYTSIYLNDTPAVPLMMRYLGIEYIVQQNDIDWKYYDARSPEEMRSILGSIEDLELVATFGKLDVYHLNSTSSNSGMVETSASIRPTDLPRSVAIDRLFLNKALLETRGNITNWTDGASIYTRSLVGDYEITAEASISEGEKIGMVLFFGEDDYYTFELSAKAANASGIGHYLDGNISSFDQRPYLCEYNTAQNITLRKAGGAVHFEVNGQSLGSVDVPDEGRNGEGPYVGFAAINAIGKLDWIIIKDDTFEIRDDFAISICPELRNWNTIGEWVIGTSLVQYYTHDGVVPAFAYSSDSIIGQLSGVDLIEPESVSYRLIDPVSLEIQINGSSGPFILILKNSYADWKLTLDGVEVPESSHFLVNGYANGWLINATGNYTISVTYAPQVDYQMWSNVSIVALVSVIALMIASLVWPTVRNMRRE